MTDCSKIEAEFQRRKALPMDINEHLETLRGLASQASHITEFGVREGHSTVALAAGKPVFLISYDIRYPGDELLELIWECVPDFKFIMENTLEAIIEPTDFLFIDSYHTYGQLKQELERHESKVSCCIALHDTESFGEVGEDGTSPGLRQAVKEFCESHPDEWFEVEHYPNNNGLTVLWRA